MDARVAAGAGGGRGPQALAGETLCFLQLENASGLLQLEDASGNLALEQCPPDVTPPPGAALAVHTFTRARWAALQKAIKATRRLEQDISGDNTAKEQAALQAAAIAANRAILAAYDEAHTAKLNADLNRLANSLNAAVSASKVTTTIRHANRAVVAAAMIIKRTQEEEEETMQVILLALQ